MEIVKYDINEAEIAKMSSVYMELTIKDLDDKEGLDAVHSARMIMVKHRTSIEKLRKSSNEDAQAFIKNNNNNAKKLLALMEPVETHLKTEEGKIEAEKARIKEEADRIEKEKIQARVDELFKVDVVLPFRDVALMTYDEYMDRLNDATGKYVEKQIQLEEERKAKQVEAERIEQIAKEQAIEAARLAKIKEEQEAIAMAQKAKEEALKAQERAIEDQKRKEIERQEQIAWQARETERLRILAEAEAAEKIEREAREKREREQSELAEQKRQAELAPDKEKLLLFADRIQALTEGNLSLKSKKARRVFSDTLKAILGAAEYIRIETKKL